MSKTFPENYWLGNKQAAISLTYDDGYVSNLDNAIPQLEIAGFRGSFYLHINNPDVQNNIARWKQAFENGHEVGNHTMNHFCGARLLELTTEQLIFEVGGAEQWLIDNIGYDGFRAFAYPCTYIRAGDAFMGDGAVMPKNFSDTYYSVVKGTYMISTTGFGTINDDYEKFVGGTHDIDRNAILFNQPSTLAPFIDFCKAALNSGGWAVIAFHGIGDDKMTTDFSIHQELLNYLKQNEDKYWVAPLRDVAKHIRENPVP
jgi:peptidoglycan-N-acetylglucosamine deacetylase